MRFRTLACSLMVLGVVAAAAQAGTMTPVLTVSAHYDNDVSFNPLPLTFDGGRVSSGPGLYAIDVAFTAQAAGGEKGWLSSAFNATSANSSGGSTLTLNSGLGWTPTNATVDTNGGAPGGVVNVFATNQDAGAPGDLQGVITALASSNLTTTANDTRNLVGTAGGPVSTGPVPAYIGTFYVNWNGVGMSDITMTGLQYAFSLAAGGAGPTVDVPGAAASAGFGAAIIPEPATLSLLGLAMVGGLGLVRRRS